MRPLSEREIEAVERLLLLSDKTYVDERGCLIWTGAKSDTGYGNLWTTERYMGTHRAAWCIAHGPIPDQTPQLVVCHVCDVRACCNPQHMFLGTRKDNHHDAVGKGRILHCPDTGRMYGGSGRSVKPPIPKSLDKNVCPLSLERNR